MIIVMQRSKRRFKFPIIRLYLKELMIMCEAKAFISRDGNKEMIHVFTGGMRCRRRA
jgi:hypothetical protein